MAPRYLQPACQGLGYTKLVGAFTCTTLIMRAIVQTNTSSKGIVERLSYSHNAARTDQNTLLCKMFRGSISPLLCNSVFACIVLFYLQYHKLRCTVHQSQATSSAIYILTPRHSYRLSHKHQHQSSRHALHSKTSHSHQHQSIHCALRSKTSQSQLDHEGATLSISHVDLFAHMVFDPRRVP